MPNTDNENEQPRVTDLWNSQLIQGNSSPIRDWAIEQQNNGTFFGKIIDASEAFTDFKQNNLFGLLFVPGSPAEAIVGPVGKVGSMGLKADLILYLTKSGKKGRPSLEVTEGALLNGKPITWGDIYDALRVHAKNARMTTEQVLKKYESQVQEAKQRIQQNSDNFFRGSDKKAMNKIANEPKRGMYNTKLRERGIVYEGDPNGPIFDDYVDITDFSLTGGKGIDSNYNKFLKYLKNKGYKYDPVEAKKIFNRNFKQHFGDDGRFIETRKFGGKLIPRTTRRN